LNIIATFAAFMC